MRAKLTNDVRMQRLGRSWSQEELARRSGLSRAEVSAIETGRLVPSTLAALALADSFECRVEHLFRRDGASRVSPPGWAWAPRSEPARYWRAEVGGDQRLFPFEPGPAGNPPHDGLWATDQPVPEALDFLGSRTLIMASCDPAAGLLAAELAKSFGMRLVVFSRSSRAALALLQQGFVHLAGIHLAANGAGHASIVATELGPSFNLIRGASWEEGIALSPGIRVPSVSSAVSAKLRWVGREAGSGARQCLDELLGPKRAPRREALDHRGVAEAVRCGWADAGVCLRLTGEEAGLDFLSVRHESYDLVFAHSFKDDPRFNALISALRSTDYRKRLGELPGYGSSETGELIS
jgi:molybdate-binding protein/DNA-binding XRE family transcriptional regulator